LRLQTGLPGARALAGFSARSRPTTLYLGALSSNSLAGRLGTAGSGPNFGGPSAILFRANNDPAVPGGPQTLARRFCGAKPFHGWTPDRPAELRGALPVSRSLPARWAQGPCWVPPPGGRLPDAPGGWLFRNLLRNQAPRPFSFAGARRRARGDGHPARVPFRFRPKGTPEKFLEFCRGFRKLGKHNNEVFKPSDLGRKKRGGPNCPKPHKSRRVTAARRKMGTFKRNLSGTR